MKKYNFSDFTEGNFPIILGQAASYKFGNIFMILFGMLLFGLQIIGALTTDKLDLLITLLGTLLGILIIYIGIKNIYSSQKIEIFSDKFILKKQNKEFPIKFDDIVEFNCYGPKGWELNIDIKIKSGSIFSFEGSPLKLKNFLEKNFKEKADKIIYKLEILNK